MSLPICRSIKASHPEAEVHYLMYEHIAPLYESDEGLETGIDKLQVITQEEKKNPFKYFFKLLELRAEKYDVVIDTLTVPATVIIGKMTGAKHFIGFDKGKARSKHYSERIIHVKNLSSNLQKLCLLKGLPFPTKPIRTFELHFSALEQKNAKALLAKKRTSEKKPIILMSPIARIAGKLWPQDSYVELCRWLLENTQCDVLIAWGPSEKQTAIAMCNKVGNKRVFCLDKSIELRQFAAVANQCSLYIGNDTGPRHISEAAGIPTFTIFSPLFSKDKWIPNPSDEHQAIDITDVLHISQDEYEENINEYRDRSEYYYTLITVDEVLNRIDPMLGFLGLLNLRLDKSVNR
jgi:heptosyltransferase-2